jgi:hypothetical protein
MSFKPDRMFWYKRGQILLAKVLSDFTRAFGFIDSTNL